MSEFETSAGADVPSSYDAVDHDAPAPASSRPPGALPGRGRWPSCSSPSWSCWPAAGAAIADRQVHAAAGPAGAGHRGHHHRRHAVRPDHPQGQLGAHQLLPDHVHAVQAGAPRAAGVHAAGRQGRGGHHGVERQGVATSRSSSPSRAARGRWCSIPPVTLSIAYGVAKVPETFIVDPDGVVRQHITGADDRGPARLDPGVVGRMSTSLGALNKRVKRWPASCSWPPARWCWRSSAAQPRPRADEQHRTHRRHHQDAEVPGVRGRVGVRVARAGGRRTSVRTSPASVAAGDTDGQIRAVHRAAVPRLPAGARGRGRQPGAVGGCPWWCSCSASAAWPWPSGAGGRRPAAAGEPDDDDRALVEAAMRAEATASRDDAQRRPAGRAGGGAALPAALAGRPRT